MVSFLSDLGTCITSIPISVCGKKQKQAIAISIIAIICKVSRPKKLTFENPNISISVIKDNDVVVVRLESTNFIYYLSPNCLDLNKH